MKRKPIPNKVLHLPLKKECYEMIESGVKTEEYREIKPYWTERFLKTFPFYGVPYIPTLNSPTATRSEQ